MLVGHCECYTLVSRRMEHLSPIIKSKEPVPTDKETGQWLDSASEEELSRLRQIIRTTGVPNAPFSVEHDPLDRKSVV